MRRTSSPYASSFSFGPGPLSLALKALIGANALMFVVMAFLPTEWRRATTDALGLVPVFVVHRLWVWQLVTYMFLHDPGSFSHIIFNPTNISTQARP